MKPAKYVSRFIVFSKSILVVLYLLIIAGSVVRVTGSGMGCPDWPKCFGKLVPPTNVSELPANYKQLYRTETVEVADFNVYHTWTEYINRLLGVLLGFMVFAAFIWSFFLVKFDRPLFILSLLQLLLMGFQGWLGSLVVSSNLAALKITLHMVAALVIIAIQVMIIYRAEKQVKTENIFPVSKKFKWILVAAVILSLVQILLGTGVREEIDNITFNMENQHRELWIGLLGKIFSAHRYLALIVLIVNCILYFRVRADSPRFSFSGKLAKALLLVICFQILVGVLMGYFAIPPFTQPLHLLLATIMFGIHIALCCRFFKKNNLTAE